MKSASTAKPTRQVSEATHGRPDAGGRGVGLAPPSYGIGFADTAAGGATSAAGVVQRATRTLGPVFQGQTAEKDGKQAKPASAANRTGMPDQLKAEIEQLSGIDMSDVRVHTSSPKPAQLNALAYAQGNDIHLAPGQEKHLPHEAWHVVQQAQGRVKPTMQMKDGVSVNDNAGLEHEADVMGGRAAARLPSLEMANNSLQANQAAQLQMAINCSAQQHQSIQQKENKSRLNSNPIQMYSYIYGPLSNESGTKVKTDIIVPGDTGGGSNVSAWPSWWPRGAAETANDFLRENFVQGHLLSEKLGGPGDKRYNLTPITRSTNTQMSASIENKAKKFLSDGHAIEFWVEADYKSHPNVADVGAGHLPNVEQLKLQTELNKMPGQIGVQITVYNKNGKGGWVKSHVQPEDVYVKNEGQALKGSFA